MEVAAISDGEMLNYSNIASDCGGTAKTVKSYFQDEHSERCLNWWVFTDGCKSKTK